MGRAGGRWAGTAVWRQVWCSADRAVGAVAVTAACLVAACLAAVAPGVALAQGSSSSAAGSGASSALSGASLGGALVTPGSPTQAEQAQAAKQAKLSNPEAVATREASRTKFEGLSGTQARTEDATAFPATIDEVGGRLPQLPAGEKVVGYPADNAAQVDLPAGKHGVIESMEPIAIETSRGHREPLNLGLTEAGGVFQPARSGAGVRIPKHLADGVQLDGSGVSLTPVTASGAALDGAEGVLDGASVLYANTQTDADTAVKPTALGFEEDTLLRSVDSPSQLSFRVGLPAGAELVQAKDGTGAVEVVVDGTAIAVVSAPSAHDAEGTVVPVSMSASGDTLTVSIDRDAGNYGYPIEVDPTVVEKGTSERPILFNGTWGFYTENPGVFKGQWYEYGFGIYAVEDVVSSSVGTGERAFFYYRTQGESRVYAATAYSTFSGFAGGKMENVLGIFNVHTGKSEASQAWLENYNAEATVCSEPGCASGTVSSSNDESEVFYEQYSREGNQYGGGTAKLDSASVDIVQTAGPSASFVPIEKWVKSGHEYVGLILDATDPGLGLSWAEWSSPGWSPSGYNPSAGCTGVQCEECYATSCGGTPLTVNLAGAPEGEDVVNSTVKDPVGLSATSKTTVKIDNAAPYNLTLTGFPADHEISFGRYVVKVSATDGSGTTPSSGIASIALAIDGKEVGTPRGSCPKGPCTATGEWSINGEEYAAGKHTFTMTATDGAGNVTKEEFPLTIESSESKGVGPGSVNLTSGAYTLNATDVAIAAPGSGLTVGRSYNSRYPTAGAGGPLGPQWSGLGMGGMQGLVKLPTGSMLLTAANGAQSVFAKEGTKFVSPTGDADLTLKETEANVFTLTEQNGTVTTFTLPSGGSGTLFTPRTREAPGITRTVKYSYQTVGGITEPTQALAPVPTGVSCTTLVKGCRALTFEYATETTAKGENESEWGGYVGRLVRISFTAWEPSKAEMKTTAVAQYSYDKQGRLRAEWDPRISPALKTMYGYDAEGHVVSLTRPGQETWAFTYISIASDPSTGRLLKAMQAPASTALWSGLALTNTAAPAIAGSPLVGTRLGVSNGTWTNGPVTYGYQWERCNVYGSECGLIAGAVNPNYTPVEADVGHTLAAVLTAINGGGAVTAVSAASNVVSASGAPLYISSSQGELGHPAGVAIDSKGNVWVVDGKKHNVEKFNEKGEYLSKFGSEGSGNGQLFAPGGIAVDSKGNLWVVDAGNARVEEFNEKGEYVSQFGSKGTGNGQFSFPYAIAIDSKGNIWVADANSGRVQEFNEKGEFLLGFGPKSPEKGWLDSPEGIAVSSGHVWVTNTYRNKIEEFNEKGELLQEFGSTGQGNGQFGYPGGIAVDSAGKIWVADTFNNRVQEFNEKGEYQLSFGSEGEGPGQFKELDSIALDTKGNVWIGDGGNDRLQHWEVVSKVEAEALPAAPGATVDYGVPVSGAGAPYNLSASEVEKWGQGNNPAAPKDYPSEATAIFRPDEPQTSPASDYRRATVYYLDNHGRTVNVAAPGGSIATSEYNSTDDVVRRLSPDNRAAALKEGSKSAETSKLLDTESAYNSEGTELKSILGPQHVVKLAGGGTVEARDHKQYYYEEGAPEGGPYELVTKVTDGAQYSGKEEEVRTTTTSYSGQSNLGWKLRKPTSVTTDPGGLNLVQTTEYESSTGNVVETKMPAAAGKDTKVPPTYAAMFGAKGAGAGQLEAPTGDAIDAHGNVWVTEYKNNRLSEFSESGTFIKTVGWGVTEKGTEKWESCTSKCKIGFAGTGNGEFNGPSHVTITAGTLYVTDYNNNRVEELNESGEYVAKFGEKGSGAKQFNGPAAVTIDSSGDIWVAEVLNHRIDEFKSPTEFIKAIGWGVSNGEAKLETCTTTCQAGKTGSETGEISWPKMIAFSGANLYVAEYTNSRVQEFVKGETGEVKEIGTKGTGNGQFEDTTGIAFNAAGDMYVVDYGNDRVQELSPSGAYMSQFGVKGTGAGQLVEPEGIAINSAGIVYVVDEGNSRVEEWKPTIQGNESAHDTKTVYYSAGTESPVVACQSHPEWANLPCQTEPVAQPGTSGLPNLPVTTYIYNMWDEPEKTTETVGATTRTKIATYDAAGRMKTSAVSSTVGTALPTITYEYSAETGILIKQCTNVGKPCTEGKPKTITSVYNTLGELTSYTDADENTATYEYDVDGRTTKANDGKGTQTYTHDTTTGDLTKLVDSAAGTFTATYDAEGNLVTEGYPNGMSANYTYNQTGKPSSLEYVKTTHCTEKCTWLSDTIVPSIHGQWLEQAGTLSHQAYTYDTDGRLTQVQSTPAGKGCTTRIYAYEEDTSRTGLMTREPNSKGECATEGGTLEGHSYDTADRLTDTGIKYSEFGNVTNLPSADAGGSELTSAFYTDNQLASQTQNGETIGYNLDPTGRTRETVATGKSTADIIDHYAAGGNAPAWTIETPSGNWTRDIPGIDGSLAATQANGTTPVLQLSNLHGDIVATAALSETETKLLTTQDTTEYGVSTTSTPPKYSWLGADELATELPTGVIDMGARSYIPQLGRFLQPDPIPGGSANPYSYTFGDPVDTSDPSGMYYVGGPSAALILFTSELATQGAAEQAAINAAARAEAEQKAEEANDGPPEPEAPEPEAPEPEEPEEPEEPGEPAEPEESPAESAEKVKECEAEALGTQFCEENYGPGAAAIVHEPLARGRSGQVLSAAKMGWLLEPR